MAIILKLDGLHCSNCVKSVEKALREVVGVESVSVSLEPQQAVVEGCPDPKALIDAVDEIGFEATL
ncbi:heavy-metal-associated domain-containing protein [Haemophilus sp. Marseille-Q0026]|jgi:putative cation transport ATPase|uniref:heavy-metal-associated domain-containing protein n=1 Tax=Haemophilus sp. Marseille-Q0026 TaxID=2866580 RepID=UPI001CF83323|nr:cation transporter [Haemophilus sp. Marseille-Q0026]